MATTAARKTILVVEDDRFYANICKMKLTKEGYNVVVMNNGAWALKAIADKIPDLILLDLVMPETDGFETLRAIRADERFKNIPVVALTNLGQPEDIKKAQELGVQDYMVKTVIPIQKMVDKVHALLAP